MLDIIGIIYFTLSTLYLLGMFPIGIYEFLDLREGFAISDYATIYNLSTYFNISAIMTGLMCGLDAITNPVFKKVDKLLYNYHSLFAFTLLGIGLFPLTGEIGWSVSRVFHWLFALSFLLLYPLSRLLILKKRKKKSFKKIFPIYLLLNSLALLVVIFSNFKTMAYPEYLIWLSLLITIVLSKISLQRK
jgi:hypothetical membrane protein